MTPEALVACPSLCRIKIETQREDWSSEGAKPSQHRDTGPPASLLPHVPQAPCRVLEPCEERFLQMWAHHRLTAWESGMWGVDPEPPPARDAGFSWVLLSIYPAKISSPACEMSAGTTQYSVLRLEMGRWPFLVTGFITSIWTTLLQKSLTFCLLKENWK